MNNLDKINKEFNLENDNIMKFKSALNIPDFLKVSINEIIDLTNENKHLKKDLKELNIKIFDMEQEQQTILNDKKESDKKLLNLNANNDNTIKENSNLKKQLKDFKEIINQLKKTVENYSNELNTKNNIIKNTNYDINVLKDKNLQLNMDNQYLLTILMRLCKLFPNSNAYKFINQIMNCENISIEEKEQLNDNLLCELQKCENYISILKDNELHSNYLNQQLTKQYQDLNNMKLGETTNFTSNNFNCDYNNNLNNYTCLENYRKNNNYNMTNYTIF